MGIKELFLKAIESDKPDAYLTEWDLQDHNETRDNQKINFKDYQDGDLLKWLEWFSESDQLCYLLEIILSPLIEKSYFTDKEVCKKLNLPLPDYETYKRRVGLNNAIDYVIPRMFKSAIHNILDFGSGYGRQANLWSDGVYVGMEGVLNSYCVQNLYYNSFDKIFIECLSKDGQDKFMQGNINVMKKPYYGETNGAKTIVHLPTWRYDLLPDNFFDMVMCVQVLREISTPLVKKMLSEFHRVLRVGGIIYIRDHTNWNPCNDVNIDQYLKELGFVEATTDNPHFKKDAVDGKDLHGVIQVYIKK